MNEGHREMVTCARGLRTSGKSGVCVLRSVFMQLRLKACMPKGKSDFGFFVCGSILTTTGYVMLLNTERVVVGARYFALFALSLAASMLSPSHWFGSTTMYPAVASARYLG